MLVCVLLELVAACGTAPGGPEDGDHLLAGRWTFDARDAAELFQPQRLLVAQTDEDTRVLLEGTLFGTRFERIAQSPAAPEALLIQIQFTRLETAGQYEVLTLALDARLESQDRLRGTYEVRGNLASGGVLRLENGEVSASREPTELLRSAAR